MDSLKFALRSPPAEKATFKDSRQSSRLKTGKHEGEKVNAPYYKDDSMFSTFVILHETKCRNQPKK